MNTKQRCRITLILYSKSDFCTEIAKNLHQLLLPGSMYNDFDLTIHGISTNEGVSHQVVDLIVEEGTDIIITIGRTCALSVQEILKSYELSIPHLFLGASDPESIGLIESLQKPGNQTTGIIRQPVALEKLTQPLLRLTPSRKSILIPYQSGNEGFAIPRTIVELKKALTPAKFQVHAYPVENAHHIVRILEESHSRFDTVLLLEGDKSFPAIGEIASTCFEHDLLLCTHGLEALKYGAACTLGGDLSPYTYSTMDVLKAFWFEKKDLGTIPVTIIPDNQTFVANIHMLRSIGMSPHDIERLIQCPGVMAIRERF